MRKIIVCEFMTLDGVIQNEDEGDGFKYGGWFFPFADEVTGAVIQERLSKPVDLLLGRKTFAAWETYWPSHSNFWPNVMTATKYVASNSRNSSDWQPTVFMSGDLVANIKQLKQTDGPDLHVMGSANMLQTLFKADLVDALELMIIPVTLGQGKRTVPRRNNTGILQSDERKSAPKGIIIVSYERDGDVSTGSPQIKEN
ncbi:MAG: dihydrofolate reductase family protein [Pirellulales bacterium]